MGNALSSPAPLGRWVTLREHTRVISRECRSDTLAGKLDEKQQNEKGMSFFGTQGPWYTVGWTMAVPVERVKGRPVLIDCMTVMRRLLRYYNNAAEYPRPLI